MTGSGNRKEEERPVNPRRYSCSWFNSATMWLYDVWLGLDLKALLLFFFVLILAADFLKYRNPPNFPPGPLALPFVGSIFSVDNKHSHHYFTQVRIKMKEVLPDKVCNLSLRILKLKGTLLLMVFL